MDDLYRANRLLARVSLIDGSLLLPNLHVVDLQADAVVYEAHAPIDAVYFPVGAVMSALHVMPDNTAIEVGTIGSEGATGIMSAYAPTTSTNKVIAQIAGKALRVDINVLREDIAANSRLGDLMFRYQQAFLAQVCQSVACNGLHKIEQRCCRWLLLTHDRVADDTFPLTHEYLAMMLGVRRAGVSEVLQRLKEQSLIDYTRGSITVQDRRGLEEQCCPCYGVSLEDYRRLLDDEPAPQ